jgi:hypothetical protein
MRMAHGLGVQCVRVPERQRLSEMADMHVYNVCLASVGSWPWRPRAARCRAVLVWQQASVKGGSRQINGQG